MSKRGSRVWTNVFAVLVVAAGGAIVGYGIGLAVALNGMQHALRSWATTHAVEFDRSPAEAHEVLAQMNATSAPRCSEQELASFRRLVLKSRYIKEAGRMRGGQLECSTTLSRAELPATSYEPSFTGTGGVLVYTKLESLRVGSLVPIVMRKGDAYVALDPYSREELPKGVKFTLTMKNAPSGKSNYLGGSPSPIAGDILTTNGEGRTGSSLYATTCSSRFAACMTVYLSIRDALREQRRQVMTWVVSGSLAGACFSMVCMSLYRRKQGIEHQLRRAIRQDLLRVVYQPLVELGSRQVVGAEALVRWTDEDNLVIAPDVFIKIAEDRGFVNLITKLVVRRVLADFGKVLSDHPEFYINVNVAASDLTDPAFPTMLEDELWRAKVSPRSLGIEITERATAKLQEAIKAIAHLRHRGHCVSIDDFGTGYSSLAYLKDLAVDGIKIDRAFTHAIGTESVTVSILPQILAMAEALKLNVVAEGLETEAQYASYHETGLPLTAQGWLFGRPLPAEEFRQKWVGNRSTEFVVSGTTRRLRQPAGKGGLAVIPEPAAEIFDGTCI